MSASDHLQGEQLRMFMRPREVQKLVKESVDRRWIWDKNKTMRNLWKQKRSEVEGKAFKNVNVSVETLGVLDPIIIIPPSSQNYATEYSKYTMGQGHHRVMAALNAEKTTKQEYYVPVVYDRDFNHMHYM
jgi:hypothetical protein